MPSNVCVCQHAVAQHVAGGGCALCSCTRWRPTSAGSAITRCSDCRRRPYSDGSNHATGCLRAGQPADAAERPPKRRHWR